MSADLRCCRRRQWKWNSRNPAHIIMRVNKRDDSTLTYDGEGDAQGLRFTQQPPCRLMEYSTSAKQIAENSLRPGSI